MSLCSLLQLQLGRHCDLCCMCQIWALTLDPSSFSNAARQAGLKRGRGCIPAGYFSSSLISASSASFSVVLIIVPPLEPHIFVIEMETCYFTRLLRSESLSLCLSDCVSINPQSHLVVLWANIHHCLVSNCMVPSMWPAVLLINTTLACFVYQCCGLIKSNINLICDLSTPYVSMIKSYSVPYANLRGKTKTFILNA